MHQTIAQADRVSVAAKIGYGVGAVGGQIFRDTPALILPIYMITVLGVPAWMAGIAILIPKAWIIFWDPLVGGWSDRKRSTWGRAPFLLAGALLAGLAFVLMFSAPDFASPWASAGYITFAFALASTAYSLFSVPYLSAAAEMSGDPRERTRILAVRICFLSVGVAVGGYALPAAHAFGPGWTGFNRMGMVYGLACAVTMLVTYATVRRLKLVAAAAHESGPGTGRGDIRAIWANKPFVMLAATYFIALTAQALTYTVFGLYFVYIIKDAGALAIVGVSAALSVVAGQPLTVWLNRRMSKRALFTLGIVGWGLCCLSFITAGAAETAWIPSHFGIAIPQAILLGGRAFVWGMFNSMYLLMALSMLTDTINVDRLRTGVARSGVYSGIFGALEKVGFALGPAIAGVILSAGGFAGAKGGGMVAETPAALTTLLLCFCVFPPLLAGASLIPFSRYVDK